MYFKVGPTRISRLCADFEYCCERRNVIERTLKKEEKSFYKFHSFTFAFLFCPTLPPSPQHLRLKWSFSRRARGLAPIQPIRSIQRHISLFVIASNSSGRYPTGDKRARNLNKTNQYSNPPFSFSLAGSLSVTPSSSPFFPLFILFISISCRISPTSSATFVCSVSFSFALIPYSLVQYRSVSFIRVSLSNRAISFPNLFNLCTDWVQTARMIGFILGELYSFCQSQQKISDGLF